MVAAARKHERVVQVGTQRRSTPHLIEAKTEDRRGRPAGQDRPRGHVLLLPHAGQRQPAGQPVPDFLDYEMWTGPAPLRPYDGLPHRRWWRTFMEYGNGIVGDMCVHMFDTVRWMLDLGWPKRISSTGGIFVQKEGKSNISDTQTATFEYDDLNVVWQHRTWGDAARPGVSVGRVHLRRQGHAQGQRDQLRLHPRPSAAASRIRRGMGLPRGAVPRGQDREGHRNARRPGHPRSHARLPGSAAQTRRCRSPTSSRDTSRRPAASWRICR